MFSKVRSLDIPEISNKIKSGIYHTHEHKPVPESSLKLWKSRGYNAHMVGVVHVRYPNQIKIKYVFPLYFWVDV